MKDTIVQLITNDISKSILELFEEASDEEQSDSEVSDKLIQNKK